MIFIVEEANQTEQEKENWETVDKRKKIKF